MKVSYKFPPQEVTMTNIRLRIEDAIPTVGLGAVANSAFVGAISMGGRGSLTTPVAYRKTPVIPAKVEAI
jgi:hypothetical protein